MSFKWGDKILYDNGKRKVQALYIEEIRSTTSHIFLKGSDILISAKNDTLSRAEEFPILPPLTLTRGAQVEFRGQGYVFEAEFKECYVIGQQNPKLHQHPLYYDKIHDMYYLQAPKQEVVPLNVTNQNMKYLLEGKT